MSCERYRDAIVDHACGAEIAHEAAAHLQTCASCRQLFDEQRSVLTDLDRELQQALAVEPSARFERQVMARVQQTARPSRRIAWALPVALAATVALIAVAVPRFFAPQGPERVDVAAVSPVPSPAPPVPSSTPSRDLPAAGPETSRQVPDRAVVTRSVRPERARPEPARLNVEADVLVPPANSEGLTRYLSLVRRGAIDTSTLGLTDAGQAAVPGDLVIAPLPMDEVRMPDVENRTGAGVDQRDPGPR